MHAYTGDFLSQRVILNVSLLLHFLDLRLCDAIIINKD